MKLLKIALRMSLLESKIQSNTEKLKTISSLMKMDKYKNSQTLIDQFSELFKETLEIVDEFEFYKNQFEEIEKYVEIEFY